MPEKCRGLPIIRLGNLWQAGLIIRTHSGVVYVNQTCNVACAQRGEEGVLVPLNDIFLDEKACPLNKALANLAWGPVRVINEARAGEIDAIIQQSYWTECLTVDPKYLRESEEAWVYVNINEPGLEDVIGLDSRSGILVWSNSD